MKNYVFSFIAALLLSCLLQVPAFSREKEQETVSTVVVQYSIERGSNDEEYTLSEKILSFIAEVLLLVALIIDFSKKNYPSGAAICIIGIIANAIFIILGFLRSPSYFVAVYIAFAMIFCIGSFIFLRRRPKNVELVEDKSEE